MQGQENGHRSNMYALLENAGALFAVVDYLPGANIFRQGDPCDRVLYIVRGRVRLSVATGSGHEAICGVLEAGAFLGADALVGSAARRQTATAWKATEVLAVAKADMILLLRTQSVIADRFIAHMLARNTRLQADLTDQIVHSTEQRLARALLLLVGPAESGRQPGALPAISQQILAEMIGTTRSRVNQLLGKFKKRGFIKKERGVLHVTPTLSEIVQNDFQSVSKETPVAAVRGLVFTGRQVHHEIDDRDDSGNRVGRDTAAGHRQRTGEAAG